MRSTRRVLWPALVSLLLSLGLARPTAAAPQSKVFPETGFAVTDMAQARFLTEFLRLGGVEVLGYPVSEPFELQGFTYQAFQRAVLQWRPEVNRAYLANVMDWLADAGKTDDLVLLGVPASEPSAAGQGFAQAVLDRESWLTDDTIAKAYRSGGGMDRYGLPTSRPQRSGPFVAQRFQRYVFQRWLEDVPGMPPKGSVVGVLAGDLLVKAGLVPQPATIPPGPGMAQLNLSSSTGAIPLLGHVSAVGDSVMLGAVPQLSNSIQDIDIDAAVSRQVATAIDILRARRATGQLGPVVVVHVGNNGTFTAKQFDEIMGILADMRLVVFVNLKEARSWEAPNNAVIADGVSRYANAMLVDWHAASINHPEYFWDDGIHLRPAGAQAYADLIDAAVKDP